MKFDKERLAAMRQLCAEIGPEDGRPASPRHSRNKHDSRRRRAPTPVSSHALERKNHQLCAQVARAVDLALSTSADPVLRGLCVSCVLPDPDASRLRVEVGSTWNDSDPTDVLRRLEQVSGWLRSEVATVIHRKRVPLLRFGWGAP